MLVNHDVTACFNKTKAESKGKSNGALMRITPIAIWAANLEKIGEYSDLKDLCEADAGFTHSHPIVHESTFLYCVAIAHVMNNPTSETRA